MNDNLVIPIVEFLFVVFLLALVKLRGQHSPSRRPFEIFLVFMALWGLFIFFMRSASDLSQAAFWENFVLAFIICAAVFFHEFTLAFTQSKRRKLILYPLYFMSLICLALIPTGLVFSGMQVLEHGNAPVFNTFSPIYTVCIYINMVLGLSTLIRHYRRCGDQIVKRRDLIIIIGVTCCLVGGSMDHYVIIFRFNMYPMGIIGNILFCASATVAMLKYGLFEIKTVLRKGTAYSMTSLVIIGLFVIVGFVISVIFEISNLVWVNIGVCCIAVTVVLFQPVLKKVQCSVDRWFFGNRYDSLQALRQFVPEPSEANDLKQLASKLVTLIANSMQSQSVCLLFKSFNSDTFETYSYFGNKLVEKLPLSTGKLLCAALSYTDDPLYENDLKTLPDNAESNTLLPDKVEIVIPLKSSNKVIGILLLSSRAEGNNYTREDIALLIQVTKRLGDSFAAAYNFEKNEKKQRDLLDRILATIRNAVLVINAKSEIILANREFFDSFQVMESRIDHKKIDEVIDNEGLLNTIRASLDSRKPLADYESRCEINGREKILVLDMVTLGEDEILIIFQDVTRERERQDMLSVNDRLATIGEMAAGLAHEINNPLTGVVGLSQLAMCNEVSADTRQDLEDIHKEARRAANIVKNLLLFSRQQNALRQPVSVNDIVADVLKLREYEEKVRNIRVFKRFADDLPAITADSLQIKQVFLNIILNAEQAMLEVHKEGTLTVTTERSGDSVKISFSDTGPGVPPENMRKLFSPFFTTKEVGKGTGLGLSICYGIVTGHRGRISAQSKPGEGATFVVELPIINEQGEYCGESKY